MIVSKDEVRTEAVKASAVRSMAAALQCSVDVIETFIAPLLHREAFLKKSLGFNGAPTELTELLLRIRLLQPLHEVR